MRGRDTPTLTGPLSRDDLATTTIVVELLCNQKTNYIFLTYLPQLQLTSRQYSQLAIVAAAQQQQQQLFHREANSTFRSRETLRWALFVVKLYSKLL